MLTPPTTHEGIAVESPPSWCDSSMESDSESSSPSNTCSTVSSTSYTLWPRFPITYNEATLSCLYGRPQVRTLNFLSIPLPSRDDESEASDTPAEVKADSPHSHQDKSPTSRPRAGLTLMSRGRVTNKMLKTRLHLQTSSGVTNVLVPKLITDAQRMSHQQGMASVTETPLDQSS